MGKFFDAESIVTDDEPVGLTRDNIDNTGGAKAAKALIEAKTEDIWFNFEGDDNDPSAVNGFGLDAGDSMVIEGYSNLVQFRCVTQSGDAGTIYVAYES